MKIPLQAGQTVQVQVPSGARTVLCTAMVLDVNERTFDSGLPQRHGVKIPVQVDHLLVSLTMPDAVYTMTCPVLNVADEGLLLAIPPDEEIQRVQRREYVRVAVSLPCQVELAMVGGSGGFAPPIKGKLQDISGGGCSVLLEPEIALGALVRVIMDLPEAGEMALFGRVRRCRPAYGHKDPRHSVGVDFGKLEEALRSKLVRYVFAVERENMRKARMAKGNFDR